ncbi:MAG: calcium/sodium antiporter [Candidatus Aenigmatarchaeota archaeon]|nr:calcium/sodium antiporter [Nanoarchaeota archaeon]
MLFLITLALGLFLMYKSSAWVIKYSLTISRVLGISSFVIGFILVSVITSLPELFVSIFAVWQNEPNLAVGTILGSNMSDITLVIGMVAIFAGTIHMKKKETLHLIELLFITSLITIFIFQTGSLTQIHGLILLALFGFLMHRLYKKGRVSKEVYQDEEKTKLPQLLGKFLTSIAILIISSRLVVDSALAMADYFLVATSFIGLTLVAFGTSLPELSVELRAVKRKEYSFAMGDLFGSAITNITLVLGVMSLISPTTINVISLTSLMPYMLVAIMFIWYVFSSKKKITRFEGLVLIMIYMLFIFTTFFMNELGLVNVFGVLG